MDREAELEIVRRAYAKRIMFVAGVQDRRVEAAFASVPRERFLGRGPWPILRWDRGYVPTPSRNPIYIYDDVLIGIVPERNLNNGQPSLHALLSRAPLRGPVSMLSMLAPGSATTPQFWRIWWGAAGG